jgi:hypothetical protein
MLAKMADPSLPVALHHDLKLDWHLEPGLGQAQERGQSVAEPAGASFDAEGSARLAALLGIVEIPEHLRQRVEPRA